MHNKIARSQIDPRYGVAPSPRVVAEGEEVPRGGGYYMVGKPYQIAGKTYYPSERAYTATGLACWYGSDFHGTQDGQWRGVRQRLDQRRASDHAAAELCARDQSAQSPLDDRARQ